MLSQVLDRLIAFSARDEADLLLAQAEWAEAAGRVFDDDALFEERATAFLEWYAMERRGKDGRVPAERLLVDETLSDDERAWLRALCTAHRSLFEVQRMRPGIVTVEDLLGGGTFAVTERRKLPGIGDGEIFEARLVASVVSAPEVLFTRAFQFHPREAASEVKRLAAKAKAAAEPRPETLFRLARLRLKALRYRHVAANKIYGTEDAAL